MSWKFRAHFAVAARSFISESGRREFDSHKGRCIFFLLLKESDPRDQGQGRVPIHQCISEVKRHPTNPGWAFKLMLLDLAMIKECCVFDITAHSSPQPVTRVSIRINSTTDKGLLNENLVIKSSTTRQIPTPASKDQIVKSTTSLYVANTDARRSNL
jgi:hypothetical protein